MWTRERILNLTTSTSANIHRSVGGLGKMVESKYSEDHRYDEDIQDKMKPLRANL